MSEEKKDKKKNITLYEEEFYESSEQDDLGETIQLVVFRLSIEWYGVEISNVTSVIKTEKPAYLPSAPPYIVGIVSLRGNILSVTDLKYIFNLAYEELTDKSKLVVIQSEDMQTGLLTDEVSDVVRIPVDKIDPTLITISPERAEYIEGACKIDDRLIAILKVDRILNKKTNEYFD